jgi:hypothetical protein
VVLDPRSVREGVGTGDFALGLAGIVPAASGRGDEDEKRHRRPRLDSLRS